MLKIHPVAHFIGQVGPFLGVFHHLLAAGCVIFVNRNLLADVFLLDAERLFHAQFHWQTVSVPASLTKHLEAVHGLVATHDVFNGARQHMVNTWHTVG